MSQVPLAGSPNIGCTDVLMDISSFAFFPARSAGTSHSNGDQARTPRSLPSSLTSVRRPPVERRRRVRAAFGTVTSADHVAVPVKSARPLATSGPSRTFPFGRGMSTPLKTAKSPETNSAGKKKLLSASPEVMAKACSPAARSNGFVWR